MKKTMLVFSGAKNKAEVGIRDNLSIYVIISSLGEKYASICLEASELRTIYAGVCELENVPVMPLRGGGSEQTLVRP